jgi:hypothetical protein
MRTYIIITSDKTVAKFIQGNEFNLNNSLSNDDNLIKDKIINLLNIYNFIIPDILTVYTIDDYTNFVNEFKEYIGNNYLTYIYI